MLRGIREVEPPRPSTKLSRPGTLPSVADVRRTDPQKLGSLMRGELDWIILKWLPKDRESALPGREPAWPATWSTTWWTSLSKLVRPPPVTGCSKFARKHRTAAGDSGGVRDPPGRRRRGEHLAGGAGHVGQREARRLQVVAEHAELEANSAATRRRGGENSRPWKQRPRQTNSAEA